MVLLHDEATHNGRNFDSLVESSIQDQKDHSQHSQVHKKLLPPLQEHIYISRQQKLYRQPDAWWMSQCYKAPGHEAKPLGSAEVVQWRKPRAHVRVDITWSM